MSTFSKIFIIFTALFLTSCSSTKLAYGFLDEAIYWKLSKYVSLNKEQKKTTDEFLTKFHQWHRDTQLPLYANYIDGYLKRLENTPTTAESIHKETDEAQIFIDNAVSKLLPDLVKLVASFSEEQTQEVLNELADKRKDYQEKYIDTSKEKLYKRRRADLVDNLSIFLGRFNKEQKQLIQQWSEELLPFEALTLKQQETFAKDLKEAFKIRKDEKQLKEQLSKIVFYRTDDWDPELEKILDINQQKTYELIAKLVNTQTPDQRQKYIETLKDFQSDFRELHKDK